MALTAAGTDAVRSPYIQLLNICKSFEDSQRQTHALHEINLEVSQGSFLSIVGPSGCGKSTLLKILAGLISTTAGDVRLKGNPVIRPPREMIYIFQEYSKSIYPWKRVLGNVAFGIRHREGRSLHEVRAECMKYIELMGLQGFEEHYPWQLSGGMQQRVAIARGLICHPDVLLMDEPFSSIDALTRADLQDLVLRLWQELGLTVVFVTHDIEEALYMSTRLIVLSGSPAHVIKDIAVDLPIPRIQLGTRESPAYLAYRHEVLETIRGNLKKG